MARSKTRPDYYFYINGYRFNVDVDSKSDSEINLTKNKMFVSSKSYGYTDIQWNNFTGESIDCTIYSRSTEVYTGEHAQPDVGGISDFYNYTRTPAAVLKYWAQNFVVFNVKTNIQSHESAKYVVDENGFSQENPTPRETFTHLKLIQYERPWEMEQTYWQNQADFVNTSSISALAEELKGIGEYEQRCSCNATSKYEECTSSVYDDVMIIQRYLQQWGYFPFYLRNAGVVTVTGRYCYYTTLAVQKFQEDNKLTVTGKFNKETRDCFIKKLGE